MIPLCGAHRTAPAMPLLYPCADRIDGQVRLWEQEHLAVQWRLSNVEISNYLFLPFGSLALISSAHGFDFGAWAMASMAWGMILALQAWEKLYNSDATSISHDVSTTVAGSVTCLKSAPHMQSHWVVSSILRTT